jgi:putative nucleotidyltransferase with HDIG domain
VEISDRARALLVGGRFAEPDENALIALAAPVVGRRIVADSEKFARLAETRPILVRELGSETERRLTEPGTVHSLDEARAQVAALGDRILEGRSKLERTALLELAASLLRPNMTFNLRATEQRRQAAVAGVKEVTITLRKGEIVVRDGDPITAHHVQILEGIREQERASNQVEVFVGVAGLIFLLLALLWRFGASSVQRFPRETIDGVFLLSVLVVTALGTRIGLFLCDALGDRPELLPVVPHGPDILYFAIPLAAATMIVRMVHSGETAALFALAVAAIAGLQVRGEIAYALFAFVGSLAAALGVARVTQRGTLLRAGLRVGFANMAVIALLAFVRGPVDPLETVFAMLMGLVAGSLSGVLASGFSPAVEALFGYTTDVKLLEMANREQPVLRELELRAPGTYHHSMMVGHLAEKAAEAIGANSLRAKVAGYYHDVGKMRRPHFFVENVAAYGGENRHDKLSPSMSSRIIQAHVKDGLEIGRQHSLARPIMNGIAQHHGTSIIRFFFEKAKEQADPEKGQAVEEHDYRYPGPKPQTREAGILMLSDSVEAASRTLADTSPARIQQLVQRVINNYFRDGQLDECSLTLRDLHAIARSFIDTLGAIRHERIDYPDATDAEGKRVDEAADEGVVERLEPRQRDRSERPAAKREDDLKRLGLP